jgi:putative hydrolase of the HAD superfamily
MGARCAVVSNWDVSLATTLRALDLDRGLDAVVTSAAVGRAKPDPAPFRAALAALGAAPERALHCGDRHGEDAEGARAAGVRPVLLAPPRGSVGDLARIETLDELPALVRAMHGSAGAATP